jgi:IS30 family transposase
MLEEQASFGEIGNTIGKDRTTVAKEIKKYSYDKKVGKPGYPYNACMHRKTCKLKDICGKKECSPSICL